MSTPPNPCDEYKKYLKNLALQNKPQARRMLTCQPIDKCAYKRKVLQTSNHQSPLTKNQQYSNSIRNNHVPSSSLIQDDNILHCPQIFIIDLTYIL